MNSGFEKQNENENHRSVLWPALCADTPLQIRSDNESDQLRPGSFRSPSLLSLGPLALWGGRRGVIRSLGAP